MEMTTNLPLIVLATLCCVASCSAGLADAAPSSARFDHYNFSQPWRTRHYGHKHVPIPVKNGADQLIYVSGSLENANSVKLEFLDEQCEQCSVPLNLVYKSISRRSAHSLGNGKIVVTFLINQLLPRTSPMISILKGDWRAVIVDPRDCTFRSVTVARAGKRLMGLLPYHDRFDLLIQNMDSWQGPKNIRVVSYSDRGEVLRAGLQAPLLPDQDLLKILMAKEYEPEAGYFYMTSQPQSGSSVLKQLNSRFEVTNRYEFQHSKYITYDEGAYSVLQGRFSVCYFDKESRKSLQCLLVGGDLRASSDDNNAAEPASSVRIAFDRDVHFVRVRNLGNGGVVIVYATDHEDGSCSVYLQLVDGAPNGVAVEGAAAAAPIEPVVGKLIEFGKVSSGIYGLYDFEMRDESYCVSVSTRDSIQTKCIVPPKLL